MRRFKNVEVAKIYKVSEKTIRNWIDATKRKNLSLQLIEEKNKYYIADTESNHLILKDLSHKGKKFQNRKAFVEIKPKQEFYDVYKERQIIDIISNLEINREIPHKYAYFNGGAHYFDMYINRVLKDTNPITVKRTIEALDFNEDYIFSLFKNYEKVNVVDIGPGNGAPVKRFLEKLIESGKLRKYIGVDISPEMLKIAQKNFEEWFGPLFPFEGHVRDINIDSIQELLFKNTHISDTEELSCINVIFFLGSTIENQRKYDESLHTVKSSMGKSDILFLGQLLDTERTKVHLNFSPRDKLSKNSDIELLITVIQLLNIDSDYYEVARYYDQKEKARIISVELKLDIDIKIETRNFKQTVSLKSGDNIVIYRHNQHNSIEVINSLNDIGFDLMQATLSNDGEQILITSRIKTMP